VLDTKTLYEELRQYERVKDEVVQNSIKASRLSKAVVYSVIRKDFASAERALRELEEVVTRLKKMLKSTCIPTSWA